MVFRNSLCHSANIGAPPSFLSSRLTEVNTTCFSCIFASASAILFDSSQSRPCVGRPVFNEQNEQERVQTSPRIIKVAVPARQHSPILGNLASEQTVSRVCLRM